MSVLLLALLAAAATGMGVLWLAVDAAGYRPLRRNIARGHVDITPGDTVKVFRLNALGGNPDIEYRYLVLDLPPGKVGVLRGEVAADASYYSVVVYDRLLQSVLPERAWGRTWLSERELGCEDGGSFEVLLVHRDLGLARSIDVSTTPDGVVFERHVGAAPEVLTTLEVIDESEALARYGAG